MKSAIIEIWKRLQYNFIVAFMVDDYPVTKHLMGSIWPWGGYWVEISTGKITSRYYDI